MNGIAIEYMENHPLIKPAGLSRRLTSLTYDCFLLFAMTIAYGVLILSGQILVLGVEDASSYAPKALEQWSSMLGLYAVLSSYFIISWRKKGQTLGMKSWRIKLETNEGDPPSPNQCLARCLLAPISLVIGGVGFFWCLLPPNYSCLHDLITSTRVVQVPRDRDS